MADDTAWVQAANMAELGILTAALLHELRQPLFAIKAQAQIGRSEGTSPRWDPVLEQVTHIEALLRYYGNFGRTDEPETPFSVNEAVASAIEMLTFRARKAQVEVQLELDDGVARVRGRPIAATQVAVNLLQNAIDAVEGRAEPRVVVRTSSESNRVRLEVEDSGPGIPEVFRARLFEPFATTKPPGRGTGLGLYIARRLVHEQRGEIALAHHEGPGTRFVVEWPRC